VGFEHIALVREARLAPVQKLLLYALASRVDSGGRCWPSVDRLCRDTGLSRRAVQMHLGLLIARRVIERITHAGRSSEYRLHCAPLRALGAQKQPTNEAWDGGQVAGAERMPCASPAHVVRPRAHDMRPGSAPPAPELKEEVPSNNQELADSAPAPVNNVDAKAPWWRSRPSVMLMGTQLGVATAPGESYSRYKDRVYQAWRADLYQARNTTR
jgi:hypothetical protein